MFPGCVPDHLPSHVWAYWVPLSLFQGAVFVLAITKVYEAVQQEWHAPKLLVTLLRDSLVYFGGALAVILVNVLIWSTARVCAASSR